MNLIRFVRDKLKLFGFRPTMSLRRSLYISTHDDIDLFRKKIGFGNDKLIKRSLISNWSDFIIWRGAGVV